MLSRIPIFLTIFIVFLLGYAIRRAQIESRKEKREKEFWDREEAAKHTPAVDLSAVEYIKVPLAVFPMGEIDEDEIRIIEDELTELSGKRMLRILDMTNTDIKLTYGTANFDAVIEMGEAFDRLLTLLCDYAKALMENGHDALAIPVLEYGVSIGSDVSANYTLLGDCYRAARETEKLAALVETVQASGLFLKQSILAELQASGDED